MLLIKCKCDCHYTIQIEALDKDNNLTCQNCRTKVIINNSETLASISKSLEEQNTNYTQFLIIQSKLNLHLNIFTCRSHKRQVF